ncbi:MAG: pilus assembly protein PilP [Deltaproteobacteria bacterium]|nr:pilus assembly protein PilP [Deltaproteobacteria bacterium]
MIMRYLISTICIALLLWGCDSTTKFPAKPTVVRKKIAAPIDNTAKVRTNKTVRIVKKTPTAAQPQNKQTIVKVDRNKPAPQRRAPAGEAADPRLVIAKKMPATPTSDRESKPVVQKKPAISTKSEITKIKTAVNKPLKPSGGESVGNKLIASNSATAQDLLSASLPSMYDPTGKIDPFEPLFREKQSVVKKKRRKKRVPRTPLERIDLAQLKLVGIILAASGNRAMVEEASGKGYVIKRGTYIGTNAGKVVKIHKEIVTVEEEFEDVFGKVKTRKRELKLPKPPGEF